MRLIYVSCYFQVVTIEYTTTYKIPWDFVFSSSTLTQSPAKNLLVQIQHKPPHALVLRLPILDSKNGRY